LLKHQDARGIDSKTLGKALETLNLYGIENVCVDADSLSERGIQDSELVLDVKPVSRAHIVELIDQADTVFNL
jgi:sulfur relay (sulfurtransferase) DsrF/TusC family protein